MTAVAAKIAPRNRAGTEIDGNAKRTGVLVVVAGAVEAAAAIDQVVATPALKDLAPGWVGIEQTNQRVVEVRTTHRIDRSDATDNRVAANRSVSRRRASRKINCHRPGRMLIADPGIAIAGDNVVAATTLELVEAALRALASGNRDAVPTAIGAESGKSGRIVGVGKIAAANAFDPPQRIRTARGSARQNTRCETDRDRFARTRINSTIKT